jgi:hypothetical protein
MAPTADEYESWRVTLEIVTLGEEDNETGGIDISSVDLREGEADVRIDEGVVVIEGDAGDREIDIEGRSASFGTFDPYSGRLGKSRLQIDGDVQIEGERR